MGRQPDPLEAAPAARPSATPDPRAVEIISVGTELLSYGRAETNSLRIAHRLTGLGMTLRRKVVVPDDPDIIARELQSALTTAGTIILTGGLGPTEDDLTREAVAGTLQRPLHTDTGVEEALFERFEKAGIRLTESNRRQAQVPEGARVIANPRGTAPGLYLNAGPARVFLLPGPPRELEPMLDESVVPLLIREGAGAVLPQRVLKVVGMAESRLDAAIEPICREFPGVETTVLSSVGILSLYFVWPHSDPAEGERRLDALTGRIRQRLGTRVYSDREQGLAEVTGALLRQRGLCLAVAESCTGGLIGQLLTDVAGASTFFVGGVISYSDELKQSLLGVRRQTLQAHGAVSDRTALEMARGVRERTGADVGLAITGIAGPGGGSEDKPVGLVYLAVADAGGDEKRRLRLPGARDLVRRRAAWSAIDLVRRRLQS